MSTKLRSVLEACGADVSTLTPLFDNDAGGVLAIKQKKRRATLELWQALADRYGDTGYWPIITGIEDDLYMLQEMAEDRPDVDEIVKEATSADPHELMVESRRRETEAMREYLQKAKESGHQVPDELLMHNNAAEAFDTPMFDAIDWPDTPPAIEAGVVPDLATLNMPGSGGSPYVLALIPTDEPCHAAAYLNFGGFNACPRPAIHVAFALEWSKKFGSRPACITGDVIEYLVDRPPATKEQAIELAHVQYDYCSDIVDQGTETVMALAIGLWQSKQWFFWWD